MVLLPSPLMQPPHLPLQLLLRLVLLRPLLALQRLLP